MKTLLLLLSLWLMLTSAPAADSVLSVRPATQAQVNAGVARSAYVSPATLAGAGLLVTNGQPPFGTALLPVRWNEYADYNTNTVLVTNSPTSTFNQAFVFNSTFGYYTGVVTVTRAIYPTNGGWAMGLSYGTVTATNSLLSAKTGWFNPSGATNIFTQTFFPTNAVWRFQTYGAVTNFPNPGLTNGMSIFGTSNGTGFAFASRVGATNTSTTKLFDAP